MHKELVDNIKNCIDFFKQESLARPNQEIVGFLGISGNKPFAKIAKNRAPDPQNHFMVDPLEMFLFEADYEFLAIFHSHIYGDSSFSEFDSTTADNCCIPFVVYSVPEDKFNLYVPPENDIGGVNLNALRAAIND